jgi:hypothetical protein
MKVRNEGSVSDANGTRTVIPSVSSVPYVSSVREPFEPNNANKLGRPYLN